MNNKLYQKLCPRKRDVILVYVYTALILTVLLVGGLFCCYAVYQEGDRGTLTVVTIILMGLTALIFWGEKKEIRRRKQLNIRKAQRLAGLSSSDLEALEEEISRSELRYKTFYLLNAYIYAPKEKMLLRYEEIGQWKTVRHTTNYIPDGAWIELTDTSGFMQKVVIRKWRQYLMELDSFIEELNHKRTQGM